MNRKTNGKLLIVILISVITCLVGFYIHEFIDPDDVVYTSLYYVGLIKLKEKEIANITARDTANNILASLIHIGRPAFSDLMIKAVWNAWQLVFTDFPLMLDDKVRDLDTDTSRQILEIITRAQG